MESCPGTATAVNQNLVIAREQLENYPIDMGLYDFDGRGIYSDPEFVWRLAVAPTALQFYNSSIFGEKYLNKMFVAEWLGKGRLLTFALNNSRTGLGLPDTLSDGVTNTESETIPLVLGEGFGQVTDIEVGPDGYLYISNWSSGIVYKITPKLN